MTHRPPGARLPAFFRSRRPDIPWSIGTSSRIPLACRSGRPYISRIENPHLQGACMPLQPPSPFHQHIALPERTALLLSMLAPWPRRGRELLVIGCGAGHVLPPLWQSGFDLSACEASPALREQARRRAPQGVEIEAASPDWLPFADNSFDWVLLRADELPPAALPAALGEAWPRGGLRSGPHFLEQRLPAWLTWRLHGRRHAWPGHCLPFWTAWRLLAAARDDCTRQAASGGPPAAGITGRTSMPRPFPACPSGPGASCVWTCRPAVRAPLCPCVCAPVWIPPAPSWSTTPCAPPASPRHKNSIPESQEKFFCSRRPQRRGFSAFLSRPQRQTSLRGLPPAPPCIMVVRPEGNDSNTGGILCRAVFIAQSTIRRSS